MNFTHTDKLYWKKEKISKGDLLHYYEKMAPFILPYLKNRPLVMKRFPEGISGFSFYQKDCGPHPPSFMKTTRIRHEKRTISYFVIQNAKSLLYVVNLGSIELHPFHSRIQDLQHPDYLVLDLDPQNVPFDAVVDVALTIHQLLDSHKIPNYCKTSGGRGLHIYIPLHGKYSYDEVQHYAHLIAKWTHAKMPQMTSLERLPKKRRGKIYIDFLQNHPMQTIACPYTVRGKPGAPVSTPLAWPEVRHGIHPSQFNLNTVLKRMERKKDPLLPVLKQRASLKSLIFKED